jgi:membrane associated rhomboid family serine protease
VFPVRDLNPARITPFITFALILVNVLVFFVWQPHSEPAADRFLFQHAAIACEVRTHQPLTVRELRTNRCVSGDTTVQAFPEKHPYVAVLVSMFLHGSIAHVLGNMWFLYLFGNNVEEAYGHVRYLLLYLIGGLVASLGFIAVHPDSTTPIVGASGAIAAVLGSYFILFPRKMILSVAFFMLIPIPAVIFLGLWFLGQFAVGQTGVAWEAHVAGFLFGAVVALLFRGPLLGRVRASQQQPQWRLGA